MKNFKLIVMKKSGTTCVLGRSREQKSEIDGVPVLRQRVDLSIDGVDIGTYYRVRVHGMPWHPWIDSEMTHTAKSLRSVAEAWA